MATGDDRSNESFASRIRPKHVVTGLVVLVLLVFALLNTDDVPVHFIVDERDAPLIVVIVASAILGALVGWLAPRLRRDD